MGGFCLAPLCEEREGQSKGMRRMRPGFVRFVPDIPQNKRPDRASGRFC